MNGQSAFVLELATRLIAAGGVFANRALTDVVGEIVSEAAALDDYFDAADGGQLPGETVQ